MDVHPTKNGINRYWPIPISSIRSNYYLSDIKWTKSNEPHQTILSYICCFFPPNRNKHNKPYQTLEWHERYRYRFQNWEVSISKRNELDAACVHNEHVQNRNKRPMFVPHLKWYLAGLPVITATSFKNSCVERPVAPSSFGSRERALWIVSYVLQ
jgi:hypothetical protein